MPSEYDSPDRRIYRAKGRVGGKEPADSRDLPAGASARRRGPRSRLLAVIVLVLVAIVIALAGVAAGGSGLNGSQGTPGTFKLLPITTTTS